jgi:hypothetical protein
MLFVIFLCVIAFLVSFRLGKSAFIINSLVFSVGFLFQYVIFLEYQFGWNDEYFLSDELLYLTEYLGGDLDWESNTVRTRRFWFLVNKLILLTGESMIAFKLINIPFLMILNCYFYLLTGKNKLALLLPFVLPYLLFLSVTNLRDMLIFLSIFAVVYHALNRGVGHLLFMLMYGFILFNLRPFSLFMVIGVLMLWLLYEARKRINLTSVMHLSLLIVPLIYWLSPLIVNYYDSVVYYLAHREVLREGHRGFGLLNIGEYLARSIYAPFPTTLASMLMESDEHTGWGYTHDIVRFINQVSIMVISAMIIFKLVEVFLLGKKIVFELITRDSVILALILLAHSVIYALYSAGAMHSRLHLFGNMFLFLLFLNIRSEKKER